MAAVLGTMLPMAAFAGAQGRKNTAIGLTGAAAYTWLNGGTKRAGRRNTAIALTGASVVAWHKYKKAKKSERRQARLANYYRTRSRSRARPTSRVSGYRRGYNAGYRRGVRAARRR
jgi:hypothetical protein